MAKRVLEVFDYEDEDLGDIRRSTIEDGKYMVNIRGLEFYYGDNKVLDDINMDIKKYEKIALVSQETFLFPKSIYENLIYGNENVQKSEVIEACKKADIHNFIESLPNKYDTFVGEKGVYLSGGERQRIAIACAFLRDSEILILDEPTSALDAETEKNIQIALDNLVKDKTAIIVAHRLVTIKNVDMIYVFNKGRVVEKGSHEELVKKQGYYYRLYKKQFENVKEDK